MVPPTIAPVLDDDDADGVTVAEADVVAAVVVEARVVEDGLAVRLLLREAEEVTLAVVEELVGVVCVGAGGGGGGGDDVAELDGAAAAGSLGA